MGQPSNGGPALALEVENAVGMQHQLFREGFCCPLAPPASLVLHSQTTAGPAALACLQLWAGFPCQASPPCQLLSLGFPCSFPGLGSCRSFCPESPFPLVCLAKSILTKPCFNVILTSLPSPVRINCSLLCVAEQHLSQRTVVTCFTTQSGRRDGRDWSDSLPCL